MLDMVETALPSIFYVSFCCLSLSLGCRSVAVHRTRKGSTLVMQSLLRVFIVCVNGNLLCQEIRSSKWPREIIERKMQFTALLAS